MPKRIPLLQKPPKRKRSNKSLIVRKVEGGVPSREKAMCLCENQLRIGLSERFLWRFCIKKSMAYHLQVHPVLHTHDTSQTLHDP